jgi:hypothetical protein
MCFPEACELLSPRKGLWEPQFIAAQLEAQVTTWGLQMASKVGRGRVVWGLNPILCYFQVNSVRI